YVPNTYPQRCAGWGYFNQGLFRSIRTSGGRRYGEDEIAVLEYIVNEIEADGLTKIEVVINYSRLQKSVCYSTTVETLRKYGQYVPGQSGWEFSMARTMWSVNGQEPDNTIEKTPAAPVAEQMSLF
ncbi:MAG: hypothetical protein KDE31_38200, partial [Caldilineaceae bacterium]|nr:hypothetical protein [Caldilineaceae bacterium]